MMWAYFIRPCSRFPRVNQIPCESAREDPVLVESRAIDRDRVRLAVFWSRLVWVQSVGVYLPITSQ